MSQRSDHSIWSGITSPNPLALRDWLASLGFDEGDCYLTEDRLRVEHSEMLWPEGGRVFIGSPAPGNALAVPPGTASIYVVVDDPDAVWRSAERIRPVVLRPLRNEDYGSRGFSIADPDGNRWSFGTYAGRVGE